MEGLYKTLKEATENRQYWENTYKTTEGLYINLSQLAADNYEGELTFVA